MQERQEKLLKIIVKEYIGTAEPVSSGLLVEKFRLPYSSATVRNEMSRLEEDGYIHQPHTSAGRVPTEKAYEFYIQSLKPKKIIADFSARKDSEESLKQAAKSLAEKSSLAVFWAIHKNNLYYTGISNLFGQPEFKRYELAIDVSKVIDQLEDIINDVFKDINYEPQILLGKNNPFGSVFGTVAVKYKGSDGDGMLGIIGPVRMDYEKCLSLVNHIISKF
ncbi:hypothetical protein COT95_01045 [Candidatus Falkowbacteria bacterium CG10_big_fil_rev_8_21_14_0_10_37_6]|uniref:Heat-inducible transcription repressor HrcA C-terminal domain-containing protein n=1 Tax=Candidatus Falkowbacteria bacterium CG10_big_fil_rev_8_21_14_0_10_37_6 TaxID=1974563 RepID=A0A2H0V9K4_9BACT|nr:MAG: hypothetical protein COT95_01045 [Candidatus Falkowbacteria bacterium CG10_big_fil_rev_8_21_14_0_10_37_6]